MTKANHKTVGWMLIALSIILLFILAFVKINIDKEEEFICEAISEDPDLDMESCPAHDNPNSWLMLLAFGISFLILSGGAYMVLLPIRKEFLKEETSFKKIDVSKLDDEEKKIYALIKNNKGSIYQSDIIKDTGFSKVKTTRILDRLESKGVAERKRRGMTNIIILR